MEIDADVILKGTRVDGIYTADPERDPNAERFDRITFSEVFQRGLKVMDMTAFTLCNENNLPIVVFDMNKPGNLQRIVEGVHRNGGRGINRIDMNEEITMALDDAKEKMDKAIGRLEESSARSVPARPTRPCWNLCAWITTAP